MLVGSTSVDYEVVKNLSSDTRSVIKYAESLVPTWARHIPHIMSNQRYYTALVIRNMVQIPFYTRKELCSALLKDCSVNGVLNEVIPITRVFEECNITLLLKMLRKDSQDYNESY